jgi:alkyl hydroperoxide reductase subunit AhpF
LSELREHEREAIRGILDGLELDVSLLLELGPEESPVTVIAGSRELDFGAETQALLEQLAALSDRVTLTVKEVGEKGSWPRTTVGDRLVYRGLPWGFELTTIVGAIAEAGRSTSSLAEASQAALATIEDDVDIPAVMHAYRAALAFPHLSAAAVEATEFAAAADRLGVVSVPATIVNGRLAWVGALPEPAFVERLLQAVGGPAPNL